MKDIGDQIWANYPQAILNLEHFAANNEAIELSDYGFLLWGNMNFNYNEATMGYNGGNNSNLSGGFYRSPNWNEPHLVTYTDSHDEERLMSKNLQAGGNYAVTSQTFTTPFPADSWWYDYVTGDSLQVSGGSHTFQLAPGEYALWLSQKVDRPNPLDRTTSTGYVAP